jgi:UDP-N-acetylmuramate--alanine ligase
MARGGRVRHIPELSACADFLESELQEGDLVVTMGAGDVWKLADELVRRLDNTSYAQRAAG